MLRSIISSLALIYALSSNVTAAQKCRDIEKIVNILHSETTSSIFLFCPFVSENAKPIGIHRSDVSIVCMKENSSDVCQFKGLQRQLNILGDGVTLIGFDFMNSKNGAVNVAGKSISFIDCSFQL